MRASSGAITNQVVSGGLLVAEVAAGLLLTVVLVFFFVKDSDRFVAWVLGQVDGRRAQDLRALGWAVWRALGGRQLHPVVALLVLTAGGVLAGLVGAFLAVPVTALAATMTRHYRTRTSGGWPKKLALADGRGRWGQDSPRRRARGRDCYGPGKEPGDTTVASPPKGDI